MMKIMIHACNKRMHYVNGFLIPQLIRTGIDQDDVIVWQDKQDCGCLKAYMDAYRSLPEEGDTWHLEDDVLPGQLFARLVSELQTIEGIMCGFGSAAYCEGMHPGLVHRAEEMYYSFPCIRIPNKMIRMFLTWLETARHTQKYAVRFNENKHADYLFKQFLAEVIGETRIFNLSPCLVEHVDDYIGGSVANRKRDVIAKALAFDDREALNALDEWRYAHEKE